MFNICVDLDFLGVERVLCILELLCQNSWGNKLSQLDTFDPISNFPIVHCCQNIALPMRRFRVYTFSASVRWCTFHLPRSLNAVQAAVAKKSLNSLDFPTCFSCCGMLCNRKSESLLINSSSISQLRPTAFVTSH